MFPDAESHSRWIHEFYKDHGDVIHDLRNRVVHDILTFGTGPAIFTTLSRADR
jgi:hypothetical protein